MAELNLKMGSIGMLPFTGGTTRQNERERLLRSNFIKFMTSKCAWSATEFISNEETGVFIAARTEELFQGYKLAQDEWVDGAVELRDNIKTWISQTWPGGTISDDEKAWKELASLLNINA